MALPGQSNLITNPRDARNVNSKTAYSCVLQYTPRYTATSPGALGLREVSRSWSDLNVSTNFSHSCTKLTFS